MEVSFDRPLKQVTESQASAISAAIEQFDSGFNVDVTADVNGSARLIGRVQMCPEVKGSKFRLQLVYLEFSASAEEAYTGDSQSPFSDEEADLVSALGSTPWSDLDKLHNSAGVEVSR